MPGYLGPAGIFSTGDPQMDQLQIDTESYDPFEGQEEDEFPWEDLEQNYEENTINVYSRCCVNIDWFTNGLIKKADYNAHASELVKRHNTECSCKNPDNLVINTD
jgi:hypothetical protein